MKKKIVIGIIASTVLAAAVLSVTRAVFPTNVEETQPDHMDEHLRTRRYRTDPQTFAAEAEKLIPALSTWGGNWKHVSTETTEKFALVKAEVPVVFFTDDLQIKAEKDPSAERIFVNVRSSSRVGKSDFGENRRHVLKILNALDARFTQN